MRPSRRTPLLACLILLAPSASFCQSNDAGQTQTSPAGSTPARPTVQQTADRSVQPASAPIPANAPHISKETRLQIIRVFETQLVYARTAFPMGTKGLQLKQGVITPNGVELEQALNLWGPALKPGDPAHISFVQIKNDHVRFEINGGPILRKKWYQRVQIYGANGPVAQTEAMPQTNAHGSCVDLYFDKYVPEMTAAQVRDL
ncbi:MAG: hypothetical protein WCD47_21180, partial [Candidatus Sulfotelmatobacter sp.]